MQWWLHPNLSWLNPSFGGNLNIYKGDPADVLGDLIERFDIGTVSLNCCYEPWQFKRDEEIAVALESRKATERFPEAW